MLYSLSIKNVALIDNVSICLSDGFNVITGETGAGKSILVDALNLLLGDRADKELVRTGADLAEVEGVFHVSRPNAIKVAALLDIAVEDELLIRRFVSADGRSGIRANGRSVTLAMLREAMQLLVNIYGQHEHQNLLKRDNHLAFLDGFASEELSDALMHTAHCYAAYREVYQRLHADWGSQEERARQMDMLCYQIEEIEAAQLEEGEEEILLQEKQLLQNAERVAMELSSAHAALNGEDGGAVEALGIAIKALESIARINTLYADIKERLSSAYYEVEDVSSELSNFLDELDHSEQRLEEVEERLQCIKELRRKYGGSISEILAFAQDAGNQLERLRNANDTIAELTAQTEQAQKALYAASGALSEQRQVAAKRLKASLEKELTELGMKNARFDAAFSKLPPREKAVFTPHGLDDMEFLFSANLGEPLKPLVKVISGGEMSRFMLAIKSIMADTDHIETMVFDEIDTGISGRMAQVTAEKMAGIARGHQVLCVTHLPQIAAMATTHFFIEKNEEGGATKTTVSRLSALSRIDEVARLTGGQATETARAHARELLDTAQKFYT